MPAKRSMMNALPPEIPPFEFPVPGTGNQVRVSVEAGGGLLAVAVNGQAPAATVFCFNTSGTGALRAAMYDDHGQRVSGFDSANPAGRASAVLDQGRSYTWVFQNVGSVPLGVAYNRATQTDPEGDPVPCPLPAP